MKPSIVFIIFSLLSLLSPISGMKVADEGDTKSAPQVATSIPLEAAPTVSAVLLECPKDSKAKNGPEMAEPTADQSSCEEQLLVNIRMNPSFHTERTEKFLILDEVYDPRRRSKAKIMSPYLIEISRGEPVMMYPLEFTEAVKCNNCSGPNKNKPTGKPNERVGGACSSSMSGGGCGGETKEQNDPMDKVVEKVVNAFNPGNDCTPSDSRLKPSASEMSCPGPIDKKPYSASDGNIQDIPRQKTIYTEEGIAQPIKSLIPLPESIMFTPRGTDKRSQQRQRIEEERGIRKDQANVGIEGLLLKELQKRSKVAQLGIIEQHDSADGAQQEKAEDERLVNSKRYTMDDFEIDDDARGELAARHQTGDEYRWTMLDGAEEEEETDEKPSILLLQRPSRRMRPRVFKKGKRKPKLKHVRQPQAAKGTSNTHKKTRNGKSVIDGGNQYMHRPSLHDNWNGYQCKPGLVVNTVPERQFDDGAHDYELVGINENYDIVDAEEAFERELNREEAMPTFDVNYPNEVDDVNDFEKELIGSKIEEAEIAALLGPTTRREKSWIKTGAQRKFNRGVEDTASFWGERKQQNDAETNKEDDATAIDDPENVDYDVEEEDESNKNDADAEEEPSFRVRVKPKPPKGKAGLKHMQHIHGDRPTWQNKFRPSWNARLHNSGPSRRTESRLDYEQTQPARARSQVLDLMKLKAAARQYHKEGINKMDSDYGETAIDLESAQTEKDQSLGSLDYANELNNDPGFVLLPPTLGGTDTATSSKFSWLTNPKLETINPVTNLKSLYKERPLSQLYNINKNFNKNSLQPVSPLFNDHLKYLPKKSPFSQMFADPNLSLSDKLPLLDFLDPVNTKSDKKLNQLTKEVDNSFLAQSIPYPLPISTHPLSMDLTSSYNKLSDSAKQKRSFLMYDDLEMRETLDDNEIAANAPGPHSGLIAQLDEDVQPCATCGGKNKKVPKPESAATLANGCVCKDIPRTVCDCLPDNSHNTRKSANKRSAKATPSVSDAWYAVFNMSAPLPFLTTKLTIFRKRHNTWWKVAPSITLSSLSGIFANANLSILFSSHVDIFQLEKALRLQEHQLIIPKDNNPIKITPKNASSNSPDSKTPRASQIAALDLTELSADPSSFIIADERAEELCKRMRRFKYRKQTEHENVPMKRGSKAGSNNVGVHTVGDLGYFPTSMNVLERCRYDKHHLCLNLLDDKVPAFTIKVKLPFRENTMIVRNMTRIKIASIIADSTTKDVLQIAVDVINEGIEASEFAIIVANCPTGCATAASTSVRRLLAPHLGESVTFLLPLILESNQKHKKFTCNVQVKAVHRGDRHPSAERDKKDFQSTDERKARVVAERKLVAMSDSRCFCMWECNCHCVDEMETTVDFNVCQKISAEEEQKAGLQLHSQPIAGNTLHTFDITPKAASLPPDHGIGGNWELFDFLQYALYLLLIMLLLGLLKALIGMCSTRIDRCGYLYVQPGRHYKSSSRLRRFLANTVFFIVFPFVFCCKCFTPSEEDLLLASSEWHCLRASDHGSDSDASSHRARLSQRLLDDTDEEVLLDTLAVEQCQESGAECSSGGRKKSGWDPRAHGGGVELWDMGNSVEDFESALKEGVFDDDEDDEDDDTRFVLKSLVQSRQSMQKMYTMASREVDSPLSAMVLPTAASLQVPHHSSEILDTAEDGADNERLRQADALVQALKNARIVYRVFEAPDGDVRNMPPGVRYCVQGYFLPSLGREYEFSNYNPLVQYRCVSANGRSMEELQPPILLCESTFTRTYASKLAVLEAADLHTQLPPDAPCINISPIGAIATTMRNLGSTYRSALETPANNFCMGYLTGRHDMETQHWQEEQLQLPSDSDESPLQPEISSRTHTKCIGRNPDFDLEFEPDIDDEEEPLAQREQPLARREQTPARRRQPLAGVEEEEEADDEDEEEEGEEEEDDQEPEYDDDHDWTRFRCDTIHE